MGAYGARLQTTDDRSAEDHALDAVRDLAHMLSKHWLGYEAYVQAWTSGHLMTRRNGEKTIYDDGFTATVTGVNAPLWDKTRVGVMVYAVSVLAWKVMNRDATGDAKVEYARARLHEMGLEMRSMREIEKLGKTVKL